MTRPPSLEYARARYHVINRGNYRRDVFRDAGAAEAFERTLEEAGEKFGWRVAAYVVMQNHFHLALETPEPNLILGMKWLQGTWVRRFNRFRAQEGRPFQGRFKSLVIEDAEGYRRGCDYIHLHPVRARVVEPAENRHGYTDLGYARTRRAKGLALQRGGGLLRGPCSRSPSPPRRLAS